MTQKTVYGQLAEAIGAGESFIIPEIFKMLADEKEAAVLLAASPPATVGEIADKIGIPASDVEKMIDPLFKKGLLFISGKSGETRYYRVRSLFQFHDATIVTEGVSQDFYDLWKKYHRTEFKTYHKNVEAILDKSAVRVIPVNIAIDSGTRIAPFEDIKRYVEDAQNLAVTKCTCRVVDGSCGKPVEVCIQINRAADYALQRGTGRKLSKEEAIEMLKMCEQKGLVHTVFNNRSLGHVICNCCDDCCINWPGPRTSAVNFAAPSRFAAKVDSELCSGCETCIDRCYFEAVTMEEGIAQIHEENCMGCGLCVVTCPEEAISLSEVRDEGFIPE
jgi:NAD-dependent dihydropyrimidine dehydrogenase PreA subunit/predicted transcriptional regulator